MQNEYLFSLFFLYLLGCDFFQNFLPKLNFSGLYFFFLLFFRPQNLSFWPEKLFPDAPGQSTEPPGDFRSSRDRPGSISEPPGTDFGAAWDQFWNHLD